MFALGHVLFEAMGATYLDAERSVAAIEMGCYGIGVTRVVAAAIEQNHDERGHHLAARRWPHSPWPSPRRLRPQRGGPGDCRPAATSELLEAGVEVLLDDRGERPGVMFADLELIGIPHRVTIGERGLKEGNVEYQARRASGAAATKVAVADIFSHIRQRIESA